jgi:vacuolar-type H+-ATPase subunit F/Vma7
MTARPGHLVKVLCRPPLAKGFALAGLEAEVVADAAAAARKLRALAANPKVAVVLVEERLHRGLPAELKRALDTRATPVVAPFPSPEWDEAEVAEDYVLEILRQAIGYRVRPR